MVPSAQAEAFSRQVTMQNCFLMRFILQGRGSECPKPTCGLQLRSPNGKAPTFDCWGGQPVTSKEDICPAWPGLWSQAPCETMGTWQRRE